MRHNKFSLLACAIGMAATYMNAAAEGADLGGGTATATPAAPAPEPINEFVNMSKQLFHFKTTKVKDEKGNEVGESKKHPSVEIYLPVPKLSRLQEFLADPVKFAKEVELLNSAVSGIIYGVARGQINDFREANPAGTVTPAVLNYERLDFTAIANMPKSERGSFVPAEEDVKAFLASYLEIMPAATNKDAERIKKHCEIIGTGFKKQRAQKDMLEFFKDAFAVYIGAAPEAAVEDHLEVIEYFTNKLDRLLKVEEKVTMDDL